MCFTPKYRDEENVLQYRSELAEVEKRGKSRIHGYRASSKINPSRMTVGA